MFGQIEVTGRKFGGRFGQKCPNFENFAWTKMGGFGKIWDQTFMSIIRGPIPSEINSGYWKFRHQIPAIIPAGNAAVNVQKMVSCLLPELDPIGLVKP